MDGEHVRSKTKKEESHTKDSIRPALSPEAREGQLISLAIDLAEKQLIEGTASAQVITHYLKLGTTMQKLEKEKLERENELLRAKTEALASAERMEELYADAIRVMKEYKGEEIDGDENLY